MSDIVRIFALGGLDENGKNMYVVEINNDIFVLEAGMKYPESSMPGIDIIIPDNCHWNVLYGLWLVLAYPRDIFYYYSIYGSYGIWI